MCPLWWAKVFYYQYLPFKHINERGFPGGPVAKTPPNTGGLGLIHGSGRCPGGGHGNPLQYSCLETPMDREAWWAIVHDVAKNRTRLSD